MQCRRCGTVNAAEIEFCRKCGMSLHWQAVTGSGNRSQPSHLISVAVAIVVLAIGLYVGYAAPFQLYSRWSGASEPSAAPTAVPATAPLTLAPPPAALLNPTPVATRQPTITPAPKPSNATTATPAKVGESLAYLNQLSAALSNGRSVVLQFSNQWNVPNGYGATLLSGGDLATVGKGIQDAQAKVNQLAATVDGQQAPPSLMVVQGRAVKTFDMAIATLGKASIAAQYPDTIGVNDVATALADLGSQFSVAIGDVQSARQSPLP